MDPDATPWRALEDSPAFGSARAGEQPGGDPKRTVAVNRSAVLTIGLAVALSIGAFAVAFGSGASSTVALDGGRALGSSEPRSGASDDRLIGAPTDRTLVVEIVGAVEHPGVFRLPGGSRVGDLVEAAGGYGPRVDANRAARELNLAAQLRDGDQVRVPSRDDAAVSSRSPGESDAGSTGPIDLNTATSAELEALPGIGPATATKIITSRDEQPFATTGDLRTRKLVGEKTFERLKDLVTVR